MKYFFRLDDIAPNMNWENFNKVKKIFGQYQIKPLIAVIPDVQDPKLLNWEDNKNFWSIINELLSDDWIIGQHGYRHLSGGDGGVLHIHKSGEFGGLSFDEQTKMIRFGKEIMLKNNLSPDVFVAPRHSFDYGTIGALKDNNFCYISDGIGLYPFKKKGVIWLPQILWRPRWWLFGMITVALHPNTMTDNDLDNLEKFIKKNRNKIGNFSELVNWYSRADIFIKFFTFFINQTFKIIWWPVFWTKFRISK